MLKFDEEQATDPAVSVENNDGAEYAMFPAVSAGAE